MIKSVRFPYPVAVVDSDARNTFVPGERAVADISRGAWGELVFETNKAGVRITVYPPPGTVVREDVSEPPVLCHSCGIDFELHVQGKCPTKKEPEVKGGPASSLPSPDPPPARPIRKGR